MPSYSWIKLYHEIIDDPKMGQMSDSLWRRTIELFLLAGRNGNDGLLPALHDSAWTLRSSDEQLEADLESLSKVGITHRDNAGRWYVSNFAKRQAPVDVNKRVSDYRERIKKHEYYSSETQEKQQSNEPVTTRYTDIDTDTDKNIIADKPQATASKSKTDRQKQHDTSIDSLVECFTKSTSIACPNGNGPKGTTAVRWYAPLNRLLSLCGKDTVRASSLIESAVKQMRHDHLTISAPQSIEKVAISIFGESHSGNGKPQEFYT